MKKSNLQISIRLHPVQISSLSNYCSTTAIIREHTKNAKMSGPYYTARARFPLTRSFRVVLNNDELIKYLKFQKILATG